MPIGLIVMQWDERVGVNILAKHPEDLSINDKTLMQIYSTHEYTGEAGLISLNVGALNIASYYTGQEEGIYMILLLEMEEDPDVFEDGLADAARLVISNLDGKEYKPLIPSLFQRLSVYPSLNEERKIAMLYSDEAKRMVIQKLQKEGSLLKSEIAVWLRDQFKGGFVEIEGILLSLIKESLIKSVSVKGAPSEVVYLINDIYITRIPPKVLVEDAANRGLPGDLKEDYHREVVTFFQNYENDDDDNLRLVELLLDPPVYETMKLMRMAVVTRDDLEKLAKKGVDDVDDVLKKLWDANMILVMQDSAGNEYYCLQSDIKILKYFPEYQLNLIREQYSNKVKSNQVLTEYVETLKDVYQGNSEESEEGRSTEEAEA